MSSTSTRKSCNVAAVGDAVVSEVVYAEVSEAGVAAVSGAVEVAAPRLECKPDDGCYVEEDDYVEDAVVVVAVVVAAAKVWRFERCCCCSYCWRECVRYR